MGFFANKTRRLIQEFRKKSERYSHDLAKEIDEILEELRTEYEENSTVLPEFQEFVQSLKSKLGNSDALKLEEFSSRLSKINRSAQKSVHAMWDLSYSQRKLTAETLREYEEFE
jgi:predicted transcriptional regulator